MNSNELEVNGEENETPVKDTIPTDQSDGNSVGEGGSYWKIRYEGLEKDYNRLHKVNQSLEEKLLNIVEDFQKQKNEIIATVEYEKSTLMADVNKLSTKLVDARIKLHDYEEQELMRKAQANAISDKSKSKAIGNKPITFDEDPNLV